jgi:single-stranded DNA-binding protein
MSFLVVVKSRQGQADGYVDRTDWIECDAVGKIAEALARCLVKGKFVVVTGRLSIDKWERDGKRMRKMVVFVENVSLGPLVSSAGNGGHEPSGGYGGGDGSF